VLGEREIDENTVTVRNLRTGEQNACALGDVVQVVQSVLAADRG